MHSMYSLCPISAERFVFVLLRRAAHHVGASLLAVLAAFAAGPHHVAAQDSAGECARLADAAERLACYDRASPPVAEPAPPAAGAKPAASSRESRRAGPTQAAGAAEGAPPSAGSGTPRDDDALSVVVVGMRKLPGRSASFTTDKGEVWVQIGAEGVYVPKVPFAAELRPASMGTYFLRPREYGWRVHVRRND